MEGNAIKVDYHSKRHLIIDSCNSDIDTFLRTLTLAKHGREELEHLLTTTAKITINISDKVGIMRKDGKYRIIGGLTWLEKGKSPNLIINEPSDNWWMRAFDKDRYVWVYTESRIEIYKGSVKYANDPTMELNAENVDLLSWDRDSSLSDFSMDTIYVERFLYPEMLYKNLKELYYFAGLHEIYHTRPKNIEIQELNGNSEIDAILLEQKAFKARKRLNKRTIR